MKKVTISNEALKAINAAGKEAAKVAAVRAESYDNDNVKFGPNMNISFDDVDCVLNRAEPASGWTLTVRDDAYYHANLAYLTHIKRHNVRVYESPEGILRHYVKQLARDKHNRRRHLQSYSAVAYHLTRAEAESKARAQRHHDLLVRDIEAIIRDKAIFEAGLVPELNVATAQGIVASAIAEACGDKYAEGRERQKYLERFTAKEHSYFLDVLRYEFKVARTKIALADESESAAD